MIKLLRKLFRRKMLINLSAKQQWDMLKGRNKNEIIREAIRLAAQVAILSDKSKLKKEMGELRREIVELKATGKVRGGVPHVHDEIVDILIETPGNDEFRPLSKICGDMGRMYSMSNYVVCCEGKLIAFTGSDVNDADNLCHYLKEMFPEKEFNWAEEIIEISH